MLRDLQPHSRRQLVDLPSLAQHDVGVGERRLALSPGSGAGDAPPPRRAPPPDATSPRDAQLPARLLATLRAQTLRLAFQPVTARRLGAVVAVLRQSRFQLADGDAQLLNLLALLGDESFQVRNPFLCRHGTMLYPLRKSA